MRRLASIFILIASFTGASAVHGAELLNRPRRTRRNEHVTGSAHERRVMPILNAVERAHALGVHGHAVAERGQVLRHLDSRRLAAA